MEKEQKLKKGYPLSKDENSLLLYDLIKEGKFEIFCQRIQDGYGLTAFVLAAMLNYGYEGKIEEVLSSCKCWTSDVFDFLVIYWGREKAEDFWIQHADKERVAEKLSNEGLVRHQRWNELLEREAYELLAAHAPLAFFQSPDASYDTSRVFSALVAQKRFEDVLALDDKWSKSDYFYSTEMMRYLLEHDVEKSCKILPIFSVNAKQKLAVRLGFEKLDDLYQYLYDKGQIDFLMKETSFLSDHGIWEPYVEKEKWYTLASHGKYDLIDWEDWMAKSKEVASMRAAMIQKWDLLVKYKQHWLLLKHFRLWRFVKSFF